MPAMSRGPPAVRAPKNRKGGTASTRNHTWKGFSQRIAELKIEPVRRGRSTILDDAELGAAFSYFHDAFVEWRELNLSETFSAFARKAASLCDSLPQVLHHSDRLAALLVEHLDKADRYAAEPLLSLMAHLAHDLGERFEKHFDVAVRTVARLAATHADVEVIEWAFSCLAWLFKYLSRLLVPDLRPVFDLMAPLLGKDRQKAFVSRFAAESLTFLIRKAAASHHRDKAPIRRIVQHISQHIEAARGSPKQYDFQNGIMHLLVDSLTGPLRGFHSTAHVILQELLVGMYTLPKESPLEPVVVGVLTACVHHTDAESFQPLLHVLRNHITTTLSDVQCAAMSSRLLFVVCGVRQGSRIAEWRPVLDLVERLFKNAQSSDGVDSEVAWALLSLIAVSFHYCPLNAMIPHEKLLESLVDDPWAQFFLAFCDYFAEIGPERFQTLLLPYFKRFVHQKAHEQTSELCLVLARFLEDRLIPLSSLEPSKRCQQHFVSSFTELISSSTNDSNEHHLTHRCNAYLNAINALEISEDNKQKIRHHLEALLYRSLNDGEARLDRQIDTFATGVGFQFLIEDSHFSSSVAAKWPELCKASAFCGQSLSFWRAMLGLLRTEKHQISLNCSHLDTLKTSLFQSLQSPSHDLRLTALHMLQLFVPEDERLQHVLSVAVLVEQTPLTLEHQRSISMRVGQIAKIYPSICSHDWLGEAIPSFCFGLLHVRLASVWDDTITALKSICGTKEGELYVTKIAFDWLSAPSQINFYDIQPSTGTAAQPYVSEFDCTNVVALETTLANVQDHLRDIEDHLESTFKGQHAKLPYINSFSRTQALRLLNALPQVAEKRSRHLVPTLLNWALDDDRHDPQDEELQSDGTEPTSARWARKDQKAMLSIFAKFVNPKVLYRADEVRTALLTLLANGDVEIQKTALQALLSWKDAAITTYREELLGLLDDARFRDELPVFLSEDEIQDADAQEILPIVLRLLYGRVIAGKRGLESKRKAVFIGLKNRFGDDAIRQFLGIAFGPLHGISIVKDGDLDQEVLRREFTDTRKQVGVMNMLDDLLSTFNSTFTPFTSSVVDPVLYCLFTASRQLSSLASHTVTNGSDDDAVDDKSQTIKVSLLKTVRQRALHILAKLFECNPSFAWAAYVAGIVAEVIQPRLDNFPIETAQSVSGLLRLFSAWGTSIETAIFLVKYNGSILSKIIACLDVASAKDEVKKFVLDEVLARVISLLDTESLVLRPDSGQNQIQSAIIDPYSTEILSTVGGLLHRSPSKDILESSVQVVARLAPHVTGSTESQRMIEIATFLLRQPSKRVGPRTKLDLLKVLHEFIQRYDSEGLDDLFDNIFNATCPMFAFVQDRDARNLLCVIMQDLAQARPELSIVAGYCHDLNSFSKSRLDEPDFDRRSRAFNGINVQGYRSFSLAQWKPLTYNMLYFIKDNDELSIRTNASMSLRRLVEISAGEDFRAFLAHGILPGIQNGMKEPSELVRTEFLAVLEELVKVQSDWPPVADLHALLSEEAESSFFSNILHIQGHRRIRALRRLASSAALLKSGNIYHIVLPLLEHFVFNKADDDGADSLSGETIKTLTALVEWMEWPQLRSLLKRYTGYLTSKEDMQKPIIKLIVGLMEALNRAGSVKGYITVAGAGRQNSHSVTTQNPEDHMAVHVPTSELMKTLPKQEKLTADLTSHFLPELTEYLHKKDETTVSLRVPVAIAITKVLLVLPPNEIEARLPGVLLDICYILKSRAQEARDMSRNTLTEIAMFMGPDYLSFILKALRTALQRGYQLHVLSYTLHHILVKLNDQLQPGDIDYCLEDIVNVVMDDTFGITGQEKDAEEYISKMKEVKSSKSFDSMDIISRAATPAYLIKLILPIRSLLMEKVNARMVQKIDELLRRIGLGFLQNPTINDRDILVFCYELIQDVYQATATSDKPKIDHKMKRYLVNMRGAAKSGARLSTSSYTYKLVRFSMDILRTVLRKHADLQTPQNLAGFLPVIGDAMVQGQEEVQVAAVRLLTTIIKVPMPELDANCPVYIDEAVRAIKGAPSSNTELAQASLKLVSAVLRDRPNVDVKERDVGHLTKRIVQDLDEPDRQGVSFGFLKAVMNRRMDIPEVYEAMDKVAEMMITNQTRSARDVARSHYFQFLTTYTHSEKRFKKQMELLLKNLRYEHMEGRLSVMEALDLIIMKALPNFPDKTQYNYHGLVFLPLINTLANDDSTKCREMASLLIKRLFQRASDRRLQSFVADLRQWLEQEENMGLRRLGIQCWGFYFEVKDDEDELPKEVAYVLNQLDSIIDEGLARRDEDDWEQLYYSLILLSKVLKNYPGALYTSSKESLWTAIEASAAYPHMWVKQKAAELIGTYFAHLAVANKDVGLGSVPLVGEGGLQLAEQNMVQMANMFVNNLLNQEITEQLCTQSVKNIAFLARCFAANGAKWHSPRAVVTDNEAVLGEVAIANVSDGGEDDEPNVLSQRGSPPADAIHRLIIRLSGLVRRDNRSMLAKSTTMQLLETIYIKLPLEPLESSLPHVLSTLNTLVDPATTIPRAHTDISTLNEPNEQYKALIDKAREIMNVLQDRMGTQEYLDIIGKVQKDIRDRREERRRKRKVEAVANPEAAEKEKRRRHDVKRVKRKERGLEQRGKRRGW